MKVSELVHALLEMDQDAEVCVPNGEMPDYLNLDRDDIKLSYMQPCEGFADIYTRSGENYPGSFRALLLG